MFENFFIKNKFLKVSINTKFVENFPLLNKNTGNCCKICHKKGHFSNNFLKKDFKFDGIQRKTSIKISYKICDKFPVKRKIVKNCV